MCEGRVVGNVLAAEAAQPRMLRNLSHGREGQFLRPALPKRVFLASSGECGERFPMGETGVGASGTAEGVIYDPTGNRIASGRTNREIEPIVGFAKEQPLTTAILALGIGYLLGKLL